MLIKKLINVSAVFAVSYAANADKYNYTYMDFDAFRGHLEELAKHPISNLSWTNKLKETCRDVATVNNNMTAWQKSMANNFIWTLDRLAQAHQTFYWVNNHLTVWNRNLITNFNNSPGKEFQYIYTLEYKQTFSKEDKLFLLKLIRNGIAGKTARDIVSFFQLNANQNSPLYKTLDELYGGLYWISQLKDKNQFTDQEIYFLKWVAKSGLGNTAQEILPVFGITNVNLELINTLNLLIVLDTNRMNASKFKEYLELLTKHLSEPVMQHKFYILSQIQTPWQKELVNKFFDAYRQYGINLKDHFGNDGHLTIWDNRAANVPNEVTQLEKQIAKPTQNVQIRENVSSSNITVNVPVKPEAVKNEFSAEEKILENLRKDESVAQILPDDILANEVIKNGVLNVIKKKNLTDPEKFIGAYYAYMGNRKNFKSMNDRIIGLQSLPEAFWEERYRVKKDLICVIANLGGGTLEANYKLKHCSNAFKKVCQDCSVFLEWCGNEKIKDLVNLYPIDLGKEKAFEEAIENAIEGNFKDLQKYTFSQENCNAFTAAKIKMDLINKYSLEQLKALGEKSPFFVKWLFVPEESNAGFIKAFDQEVDDSMNWLAFDWESSDTKIQECLSFKKSYNQGWKNFHNSVVKQNALTKDNKTNPAYLYFMKLYPGLILHCNSIKGGTEVGSCFPQVVAGYSHFYSIKNEINDDVLRNFLSNFLVNIKESPNKYSFLYTEKICNFIKEHKDELLAVEGINPVWKEFIDFALNNPKIAKVFRWDGLLIMESENAEEIYNLWSSGGIKDDEFEWLETTNISRPWLLMIKGIGKNKNVQGITALNS